VSHLVEGLVNLIGMMQNSSTHDLMQIINEKIKESIYLIGKTLM